MRSVYLVAIFLAATASAQLAEECNATLNSCMPPDCRCMSSDIPGGFDRADVPQIVHLTFDLAVTSLNYDNYYAPLLDNRFNPNGCPIKANFFATHEYTNYSLVNDLYNKGFEISSNSITHRTENQFWITADNTTWAKELIGMRNMLNIYGNIPTNKVVGTRAPFFLMGGNDMFSAIRSNGINWDSSWPTSVFNRPGDEIIWPYTLDYASPQDCSIGRCPTESFPGTWVSPLIDMIDINGNPCATLDTCAVGSTNTSVFNHLKDNFERHYNGSRAPFGIYLQPGWFQTLSNYQGYKMFLDSLDIYDDVYITSISQAIEWVKNPAKIVDLPNFAPWQCTDPVTPQRCIQYTCAYPPDLTPMNSERYMTICNSACPAYYPWYDNIYGEIPTTVEPTSTPAATTIPSTAPTTVKFL